MLAPAKPKEKAYKELMATLNNHFSPPPSEIANSFCFNMKVQLESESIVVLVANFGRWQSTVTLVTLSTT